LAAFPEHTIVIDVIPVNDNPQLFIDRNPQPLEPVNGEAYGTIEMELSDNIRYLGLSVHDVDLGNNVMRCIVFPEIGWISWGNIFSDEIIAQAYNYPSEQWAIPNPAAGSWPRNDPRNDWAVKRIEARGLQVDVTGVHTSTIQNILEGLFYVRNGNESTDDVDLITINCYDFRHTGCDCPYDAPGNTTAYIKVVFTKPTPGVPPGVIAGAAAAGGLVAAAVAYLLFRNLGGGGAGGDASVPFSDDMFAASLDNPVYVQGGAEGESPLYFPPMEMQKPLLA